MKYRWIIFVTIGLLAAVNMRGASPGADFDELYELLRKNLTGVTEGELEQAATLGLISQLYPHVTVATNRELDTNVGKLAATSILEGAYGYLRFGDISDGIDKEFNAALKRLSSTNKLKGLVLDLRFAEGT